MMQSKRQRLNIMYNLCKDNSNAQILKQPQIVSWFNLFQLTRSKISLVNKFEVHETNNTKLQLKIKLKNEFAKTTFSPNF